METTEGNAIRPTELRLAAGHFATGVTVVTTRDGSDRYFGITMNAVTSLSLDPPLYVICVDKKSDTLSALMESRVFAVNVLTAEQEGISNVFASKKRHEKFAGVGYEITSALGVPVISGALVAIECRVTETYPGGDHTIIVGQVESIKVNGGEPLLYYRGRYAALEQLVAG